MCRQRPHRHAMLPPCVPGRHSSLTLATRALPTSATHPALSLPPHSAPCHRPFHRLLNAHEATDALPRLFPLLAFPPLPHNTGSHHPSMSPHQTGLRLHCPRPPILPPPTEHVSTHCPAADGWLSLEWTLPGHSTPHPRMVPGTHWGPINHSWNEEAREKLLL